MNGKAHRHRLQRHRKAKLSPPMSLVAVAVLLVGTIIYQIARPRPGLAIAILESPHIDFPQTTTYNSTPPTSGPHYETIARWGIHSSPIPNELQVHNLEDGGVLVQYNCTEACPDLVSQLEDLVAQYDEGVILAPYPEMDSRIALTAWGRIDSLEGFDERRIVQFINTYSGLDHHE